ncbi:MAG: thymidine kinase, partial [Chloroflexi bacterium]
MSNHTRGRIELICGSMFSGKTEELIRRLRRAVIAKQKVQVFKPVIDDRYHVQNVTSHNGAAFEAQPVNAPQDIFAQLDDDTTVVAIDEVQFFEQEI